MWLRRPANKAISPLPIRNVPMALDMPGSSAPLKTRAASEAAKPSVVIVSVNTAPISAAMEFSCPRSTGKARLVKAKALSLGLCCCGVRIWRPAGLESAFPAGNLVKRTPSRWPRLVPNGLRSNIEIVSHQTRTKPPPCPTVRLTLQRTGRPPLELAGKWPNHPVHNPAFRCALNG